MLNPVCYTCGAIHSNIQIPYQNDIRNLCEEYGVDLETMSRGIVNNAEFNAAKRNIIDKYTDPDRICCRMRLMNFSDIVNIIGAK